MGRRSACDCYRPDSRLRFWERQIPTVGDADFEAEKWEQTSFKSGNGGESHFQHVSSGGNPGAYGMVKNVVNSGPPEKRAEAINISIYRGYTFNAARRGAIESIDYFEDAACISPCFGQGQATGPALLQGGKLYVLNGRHLLTGEGGDWIKHKRNGLTSAEFGLVESTPTGFSISSNHPDFSVTGAPIQFGFFRLNGAAVSGAGYVMAAGIDNWQVRITTKKAD